MGNHHRGKEDWDGRFAGYQPTLSLSSSAGSHSSNLPLHMGRDLLPQTDVITTTPTATPPACVSVYPSIHSFGPPISYAKPFPPPQRPIPVQSSQCNYSSPPPSYNATSTFPYSPSSTSSKTRAHSSSSTTSKGNAYSSSGRSSNTIAPSMSYSSNGRRSTQPLPASSSFAGSRYIAPYAVIHPDPTQPTVVRRQKKETVIVPVDGGRGGYVIVHPGDRRVRLVDMNPDSSNYHTVKFVGK